MPKACAVASYVVLALLPVVYGANKTCESYGMDFQNGGLYFQNATSKDPFTFVSQFQYCQDDFSDNILVDPAGEEYLCSKTSLVPDNTDQMSTCPLNKHQLWSGAWSVLIISNNGDAEPIAYERDFLLNVGTPFTETFTPTVTIKVAETPVYYSKSVTTDTMTTLLEQSTVTEPSTTIRQTVTVTPTPEVNVKVITAATITVKEEIIDIVKSTVTHTASCDQPRRPSRNDPTCSFTPTLVTAAALEPTTNSFRLRDRHVPANREERVRERKERLRKLHPLNKRAPDVETTTITETNTDNFVTATFTSTAEPITVPLIVGSTITSTSTPPVLTVFDGEATAPVVSITAPTPTRTETLYTVATTSSTWTGTVTVIITTTYEPPALVTACRQAGGILS